jgi:hypothetical protein
MNNERWEHHSVLPPMESMIIAILGQRGAVPAVAS